MSGQTPDAEKCGGIYRRDAEAAEKTGAAEIVDARASWGAASSAPTARLACSATIDGGLKTRRYDINCEEPAGRRRYENRRAQAGLPSCGGRAYATVTVTAHAAGRMRFKECWASD